MVDYQVVDTSAILSVNNPPVNAARFEILIFNIFTKFIII